MTNNEFKKVIDHLLKPLGFKKSGNKWTMETEELEKIVEIQKSNFSNSYYLNYGYNFKDLDYKEVSMHIGNRLGSLNQKENNLFIQTLDLESLLNPIERIKNLEHFIKVLLIPEIRKTNTKQDIIEELKSRNHLNNVFLTIKRHLNIVVE
tara:strand:+ start:57 stop:506 length:450 start_codon:yes stop_codon:yes gene_type:complete